MLGGYRIILSHSQSGMDFGIITGLHLMYSLKMNVKYEFILS